MSKATKALATFAASAAFALSLSTNAQAALVGGNVTEADFVAAIGEASNTGWVFVGATVPAFTLAGSGELQLRFSDYGDSFGYSDTAHGSQTVVFGTGATAGTVSAITPGFSPFLFYFDSDGGGGSDANTEFTDGFQTGPGTAQSDIEIYLKGSTYAFFYDDAGGTAALLDDDNDYNDLVVTFTPNAVPEPASLALLGSGLLGLGLLARRRRR